MHQKYNPWASPARQIIIRRQKHDCVRQTHSSVVKATTFCVKNTHPTSNTLLFVSKACFRSQKHNLCIKNTGAHTTHTHKREREREREGEGATSSSTEALQRKKYAQALKSMCLLQRFRPPPLQIGTHTRHTHTTKRERETEGE